ncbi:hypothetical protein EYC84_000149 [Monilinia fructicola]|uniref:Uncharacterized protein n=1 Tax=Monilinia fructicola TaxID=38448 RepID=A0A5M9JMP2_MONFR|nr:hypothetical protein EYC84_000149 [Monilinia fructicola]
MGLRSGLDVGAKELEGEIQSQPPGTSGTRTDMEEQNFTDFSSNRAEIGSPRRRSGSPLESVTSPHQSSNGDSRPGSLLSAQYEEYQTAPYRAIAPAPYPQATYSTPSSSSYQTPYSESSIQPPFPTRTSSQQHTNTNLSESSYHPYLQPYTTSSQESINSSPPYPNPPPPAVPTPPPASHHRYPPSYISQYTAQSSAQPNQAYLNSIQPQQTYNPLQTQPLATALPQSEQPDPWTPLAYTSPPESRKRRASETDVVLCMGGGNADWEYKDKMREELDNLEAELGNKRVGEEGRKRRRKRQGRGEESGNAHGHGSGRRWSGDDDGDEHQGHGGMGVGMGMGIEAPRANR